jgi:hypothetical protein
MAVSLTARFNGLLLSDMADLAGERRPGVFED